MGRETGRERLTGYLATQGREKSRAMAPV
jgi:hypothetical protein